MKILPKNERAGGEKMWVQPTLGMEPGIPRMLYRQESVAAHHARCSNKPFCEGSAEAIAQSPLVKFVEISLSTILHDYSY